MVQEVQSLNKRIESINVQRTKAEAKVDMLKKQLLSEINSYKSTYGVDLSDKNFAKLSGKVKAEMSMVSESIKAEFAIKEKVVEAIEGGRYEEAYQLLGIENPNSVDDVSSCVEVETATVEEDEIDLDMGMDFGVEEEEVLKPVERQSKESAVSKIKGGITLDDMMVEDDEEPKSDVKGESALDAVGSMEVEDDDADGEIPSMGDEDWGFGDILSGSQFQNN